MKKIAILSFSLIALLGCVVWLGFLGLSNQEHAGVGEEDEMVPVQSTRQSKAVTQSDRVSGGKLDELVEVLVREASNELSRNPEDEEISAKEDALLAQAIRLDPSERQELFKTYRDEQDRIAEFSSGERTARTERLEKTALLKATLMGIRSLRKYLEASELVDDLEDELGALVSNSLKLSDKEFLEGWENIHLQHEALRAQAAPMKKILSAQGVLQR